MASNDVIQMYKRYTDYNRVWEQQTCNTLNSILRKVKANFKVESFAKDLYEDLLKCNNGLCPMSFDFANIVKALLNRYPILKYHQDLTIKVAEFCIDRCMYYYHEDNTPIRLYLEDDVDILKITKSTKLDAEVWRKALREKRFFSLEFFLGKDFEDNLITPLFNGSLRACLQLDRVDGLEENDAVRISSDFVASDGTFIHTSLIVLLLGEERVWVVPPDLDYFRDNVPNFDRDVKPERLSDKYTKPDGLEGKLCGQHVASHLDGYYISFDDMQDTLTLLFQSCLSEYFKAMEISNQVQRESTAVSRVSKRKSANNVKVISKDLSGQDIYVKLSTYAGRKVSERKAWQGGHHESPIPHDVCGHWREYKSGKRIWIEGYHKSCSKYTGGKSRERVIIVNK